MSDENAASSDSSAKPSTDETPPARRASKARPKKKAKLARASKDTSGELVGEKAPTPAQFPEFPEESSPDSPESEVSGAGIDAPVAEGSLPTDAPKRKRRRKKGKTPPPPAQVVLEADEPLKTDGSPAESTPSSEPKRRDAPPRPKLDPEMLAKCAWKIYLAEISEEGVALVGDGDAKELARRCFRLAEIFLDEQTRRR